MAQRYVDVIQVGKQALPFAGLLPDGYRYLWAAVDTGDIIPKQPLFKKDRWNPTFRDAVVLIDATCPWLADVAKLTTLPANRIIVENSVQLSDTAQHILELKGAHRMDFADADALANTIYGSFYSDQNTYKIDFSEFVVDPAYDGPVRQVGEAYREFSGDFGPDWVRIGSVNQVMWVGVNAGQDVVVENATNGDLELMGKVQTFDGINSDLNDILTATGEELYDGVHVPQMYNPRGLQLHLYVRGRGTAQIGDIHWRRTRSGYGETLVGGEKVVDPVGMKQEVQVYFDAGDLKPPLCVYFAGYQTAEKFEGFGMMRRMGTPFMLIMDPRLEGGSFYMGSQVFEDRLTAAIQHRLDELGFTNDQLILSGISMGTFASLYYGARLNPHGIIVGKPLVHLGTIAQNNRIKRPNEFGTSLDMLLLLQGGTSHADIKALNDRFWKQFRQGHFANTTFAFAYMFDDDYDQDAFPSVQADLKNRYPTVRIWQKGFVGRHNDETAGVVNWFLSRYSHMLAQDFGREAS